MDPMDILASHEILVLLEKICKRRCRDQNEADERFLFILEKLQENDCARLRAFEGRNNCQLSTYITTLANRSISDYSREKKGRFRPPGKIAALGDWAKAIYRYICLDLCSHSETYEMVALDGLFEGTYEEFLQKASPVLETPCPEKVRFSSLDENIENRDDGSRSKRVPREFANPSSEAPDGSLGLSDSFEESPNPLLLLIDRLTQAEQIRAGRIIRKAVEELPSHDQNLVRLIFWSGHSRAKAARVLGISSKAAKKRLDMILRLIRKKLLKEGIR